MAKPGVLENPPLSNVTLPAISAIFNQQGP